MSESTSRKKNSKPAKVEAKVSGKDKADLPNPAWFAPVMFSFMLVGLIWIITYYISGAQYPLGAGTPINLESWNIAVGFGIAMVGFIMSTRWK